MNWVKFKDILKDGNSYGTKYLIAFVINLECIYAIGVIKIRDNIFEIEFLDKEINKAFCINERTATIIDVRCCKIDEPVWHKREEPKK